jgi:hypothetical protein
MVVQCRAGEVSNHSLVCTGLGGTNLTLVAACNGTRAAVPLFCPPMRACIFFNTTSRQWSDQGCVPVSGWRADQPGPLVCQCNHLTDFSGETLHCIRGVEGAGSVLMRFVSLAVYTHANAQLQTVVLRYKTDREFLRRSIGLIIAVLVVHVGIFVTILRSQFKKPSVTPTYINTVRLTRAYAEVNAYFSKVVGGGHAPLTAQEVSVSHFFSPTRRYSALSKASNECLSIRTHQCTFLSERRSWTRSLRNSSQPDCTASRSWAGGGRRAVGGPLGLRGL